MNPDVAFWICLVLTVLVTIPLLNFYYQLYLEKKLSEKWWKDYKSGQINEWK